MLNRLDQAPAAEDRIGDLLQRLDLAEEARVGKVLQVCDELGQVEQRRQIAEVRYMSFCQTRDQADMITALCRLAR